MERTRNGKAKLNRLRATRHPVSALRKEAAGPLSRDPEGRPHDLAPCTLEPWAELQRGRDGALAGRPPGPGAAPHAARHILVFSGLDRPVILERRLVSRQNECQSHRFLDPCVMFTSLHLKGNQVPRIHEAAQLQYRLGTPCSVQRWRRQSHRRRRPRSRMRARASRG